MKKILITLVIVFLTSCTWNYKNGDIQKNIVAEDVKELEKELLELEQKKAKEALDKIKLENEIASEVLENFLKNEDFDIKAEIEKTKSKYNDSLGPILEYEHEEEEEEEEEVVVEETNSGRTLTGSTLTGTTINDDNIETNEDKLVYSGEIELVDSNVEKQLINPVIEIEPEIEEVKYNTQLKKGRSGTYTMYIGLSDACKGGLEMQDLENNKKWLFENTCDKMIYNFELAVGGIKVYYNNQEGVQNNEFVTLK